METKERQKLHIGLLLNVVIPLALIVLYHLLKGSAAVMGWWVTNAVAPVEQMLGRLWSIVPFSVAELLIAVILIGGAVWLIRAVILVIRQRELRLFVQRVVALGALFAWIVAGVCWMWNATYHAPTFTQRSGLDVGPYSVDTLAQVTEYYAQQAALCATQVSRDEDGHMVRDTKGWLAAGTKVYDNIVDEFPCLELKSVKAKPLICSKLQSIFGFTGVYIPFTGEANVNVHSPACLLPATIAHEMSHQRMVASEQEANFVGIAAATTCDDVTFQYSGWLQGLICLCNALYPVSPERWSAIAQEYFNPELSTDWRDNNAYWAELSSPVEEAAVKAYDSFLKGNGQTMGIQSYGACVDLLVAFYRE